MKGKIALAGVGLALLAALLLWGAARGHGLSSDGDVDGGVPLPVAEEGEGKVTRAEMAKMMSLLAYDEEELEGLDRVIIYEDTAEGKWYDKYVNGIYAMGLLGEGDTEENAFRPMAYLTYSDVEGIVDHLAIQTDWDGREDGLDRILGAWEAMSEGRPMDGRVAKAEWLSLYEAIDEEAYGGSLEEESLFVLRSWEDDDSLGKWEVATDRGRYSCEGIPFLPYEDQAVRALRKGREIACVAGLEEEATLPNVWIAKEGKEGLGLFVNGYAKTYPTSFEADGPLAGKVADVTLSGRTVTGAQTKEESVTARALLVEDDDIELEGLGKVRFSEDFRIYRVYGDVGMESVRAILVGYDNTEFVMSGGEICAALIRGPIHAESIRVLIRTDQFAKPCHSKVRLTADCDFSISYGKKEREYGKGEEVAISPGSALLREGRLIARPKKEGGKITLLSVRRNGVHPSYRGRIEVASREEGLAVINELPLEEYLYAVLPSEMPASYGQEALKAQAVCARSYAYRQLLENGRSEYGAHVDDSSSYQVYNNIPENEASIEAVKETYGETLEYDGEVIMAYYFSTSCGHTASPDEVWDGAEPVPYLPEVPQGEEGGAGWDLSDEDAFRRFLTTDSFDAYEKDEPWYRWGVTLSARRIEKSVNESLGERYEANPDLILTLQPDGSYQSVPVSTVGNVEGVEVTERRAGGIVTEIVIRGSENTVKVRTEYNIRKLLAPGKRAVARQDGSRVEGLSMLPSAFFLLERRERDGAFAGCRVLGGGYGHGVGMSQNGAKAMAAEGKTYEEILRHFYPGTEMGAIYHE